MVDNEFVQKMEDYINMFEKLIAENPEKAKKEAKESLIRSGIANENGDIKEIIVSWD